MIIYNPEQDTIAELVPLYAIVDPTSDFTVSKLDDSLVNYSISMIFNDPAAYVIFVEENKDGVLISAKLIRQKLSEGVIIEV
jgi:hypothetical protein